MTQVDENPDTPKSPLQLRGPSLSPLEEAMKARFADDESDPTESPGTPPSPSAIPRHQRLYGYERQRDVSSPNSRNDPRRSKQRSSGARTTDGVQKASVNSPGGIPTPRSAKRREPQKTSQYRPQVVPSTARSKSEPKPSPASSKSFKNAATAVVASQRFGAAGLMRQRTNSSGSGSSKTFKNAATAVVASQRFGAAGLARQRTNSGGSGRSTGDSSVASAVMSEEGASHCITDLGNCGQLDAFSCLHLS